jgi:hypothetical protein
VLGGRGAQPARCEIGYRRRVTRRPRARQDLAGGVADPEKLVARHSALVVDGEARASRERVGTHAGRPDERGGGEGLAARETHDSVFRGLEAGLEVDFDAAPPETAERVVGKAWVSLGEDSPRRLDEDPPRALAVEFGIALEGGAAEVFEFGERLHPRVAATDEDERQHRPPPFGIGGLGRGLEAGEDVVAEVDRLFDRLEADGSLREPGDGQDAAHRSGGQDHLVVRQLHGFAVERAHVNTMSVVVDDLGLAHHEPGAAQNLAQRNEDVAGLDRARRRFGKERLVLEIVLDVHEHDLVAGLPQPLFESQGRVHTDEPASAHDHPHIVKRFTSPSGGQSQRRKET